MLAANACDDIVAICALLRTGGAGGAGGAFGTEAACTAGAACTTLGCADGFAAALGVGTVGFAVVEACATGFACTTGGCTGALA